MGGAEYCYCLTSLGDYDMTLMLLVPAGAVATSTLDMMNSTIRAGAVLTIMDGYLSNRDIAFRAELAEPRTRFVLTDAARVREVLVNILGNAVKFTDDGSTIAFEAAYLPGADEHRDRAKSVRISRTRGHLPCRRAGTCRPTRRTSSYPPLCMASL